MGKKVVAKAPPPSAPSAPVVKKPAAAEVKVDAPSFSKGRQVGYTEGRKDGFAAGEHVGSGQGYRQGYNDGRKRIVSLAEEHLAEWLKLPNRAALAKSGKLPAWWIATLIETMSAAKVVPEPVALTPEEEAEEEAEK